MEILDFLKPIPSYMWGTACSCLVAIITAFGGGKILCQGVKIMAKLLKKLYRTEEDLVQASEDFNEEEYMKSIEKDPPSYAQNLKPVYRFNKAKGILEKTDEFIDIQEAIDSFKDVALQTVLERLMPVEDTDKIGVEYERFADDLDGLAEAFDIAESYREQLNMPLTATIGEIYKGMAEHAKSLKEKLSEKIDKKDVKNDEKNA